MESNINMIVMFQHDKLFEFYFRLYFVIGKAIVGINCDHTDVVMFI